MRRRTAGLDCTETRSGAGRVEAPSREGWGRALIIDEDVGSAGGESSTSPEGQLWTGSELEHRISVEVWYCARQGKQLGSGSAALAIDAVVGKWRHGSRLRSGFSFSLYLDLLLIPPSFCVRFRHENCIDVKNEM
ncbi:uncharacterized protein M6B38_341650 [Iris pallida]|uniref:Uncharacterized protein n=1 Tax=Iris pallida TaxID=29817 RepID=A0AAX6GWX7_IRIPA|nr:uncharacterized protein M6B38_341645 [Iris pallida]KAJ6833239.1 uncharacterized protein M6B38_341650 [Iris pallida]